MAREQRFSSPARRALKRDRAGLPKADPGPLAVTLAHMAWIKRAQDASRLRDGGVARDFSLIRGWSASYPETTGYIVPTALECSRRFGDKDLRQRAQRMLG